MAVDGVIVSPLFNGGVTNLVQGEIVRQSVLASNTALRALATSAAGVQGTLGVVLSGSVGPGGPVIVETAGRQRVLLEIGLTPVVGQWVFVSATVAGRGTNVQPTNAAPIGTILDTSTYSRDSRVVVSIPVVLTPATANQTGLLSSADFSKLATMPSGAGIQGTMVTPQIDFLAAPASYEMTPNFAGRYFFAVGIRWFIDLIDGTITTGPTDNLGNNAAKTNVLANAIHMTAANINAINTAGQPGPAAALAPVIGVQAVDCATPHSVQITAAAVPATATTCKGRVFLAGFWLTP